MSVSQIHPLFVVILLLLPLFSAIKISCLLIFLNTVIHGLDQRETREPPESVIGTVPSAPGFPVVQSGTFQRVFLLRNASGPLLFVAGGKIPGCLYFFREAGFHVMGNPKQQ